MSDENRWTGVTEDLGEFRVDGLPLFLDARQPRSHAVVSHAHSDHLGRHQRVLAHPATCDLLRHRLAEPEEGEAVLAEGVEPMEVLAAPYFEKRSWHGAVIDLFPAGHVLGSALVRIETPRGRLLYTGDFRMRTDALTVPAAVLPADGADVVLMECTYGLPRYRFPERAAVVEQLCDTVAAAFAEGRQPICLCYSLGKAQEVGRILTDNGFAVTMHGAAHAITDIYHKHGVRVGDMRRYEAGAIAGTVLIAPPHVRNARMIANLKNGEIIVITGWALDTSAKYRYQAHHALALSDHADFDELNAFVDAMRERGASHFLLTHGFVKEFGRHLRGRGVSASPARLPPQMTLFED